MRTDLRLNYNDLDDVSNRITAYRSALVEMDNALKGLEQNVKGQKAETFQELNEKIGRARKNISSKKETLRRMKKILDDYTQDMENLVGAVNRGQLVRVDPPDISFNLKQIEKPIKKVKEKASGTVWTSGSGSGSPIETAEERARRECEERNYQSLVKGHNQLKSLSGKLNRYMEQLWKIHSKYIKPFEKTDDTYRKQLNTIYKEETKIKDKWKNFLNDFRKISLSYLKALAEAFITTVVCVVLAVQAPFVLAGLVVALAVGIAVMIAVPEESVPDWMKGAKEAADGVREMTLKIMKDGPVVIVEIIGQGFMDQIQSPEGIAATAGTVTGMLAGGMAGKKINTKLSAGKGVKVNDEIDGSTEVVKPNTSLKTRLPRTNGKWSGEPGNGKWFANKLEVKNITKGKGVEFSNGKPNFSPWSKGKLKFKKGVLNGSSSDFNAVYDKIKQLKGFSSRNQAKNWLKEKGLTPHHKSSTEIELIPIDLHKNIPHIGSASELRGGK